MTHRNSNLFQQLSDQISCELLDDDRMIESRHEFAEQWLRKLGFDPEHYLKEAQENTPQAELYWMLTNMHDQIVLSNLLSRNTPFKPHYPSKEYERAIADSINLSK